MKNIQSEIWSCYDQVNVSCILLALLFCLSSCAVEEDDDHHLEHLIPEHKPSSYADSVEQLSTRGSHFFANELSNKEVSELQDIVNWLPELAADSDLKRPQWEQVQAATTQFQGLIDIAPNPTGMEQWNEQVAALTELIPSSDINAVESRNTENLKQENTQEQSYD